MAALLGALPIQFAGAFVLRVAGSEELARPVAALHLGRYQPFGASEPPVLEKCLQR